MSSLYCIHKFIDSECPQCKPRLRMRCLLCFQEDRESTGARYRTKCQLSKDGPILSINHKMSRDGHSSPICLLCKRKECGQKMESTLCVDGYPQHHLRPYPFRCEECKGTVFVLGEKAATFCHMTFTGQHVIAVKGLVGPEQPRMVARLDRSAHEEIEAALKTLGSKRRFKRLVWRSRKA